MIYGILVANVATILHIRTLRIKFRIKSGFEDSPQLVPACQLLYNDIAICNYFANTRNTHFNSVINESLNRGTHFTVKRDHLIIKALFKVFKFNATN